MKKPPGPRGRDVLGFFGIRSAPNMLAFLEQTARKYGPISYFRVFHQHTYFVDDPDLIKEVLVAQQHRFSRDVRASKTISGTPIIVISANGEKRDVEAGLEAGADTYLVKPFQMEELLDSLATLLQRPG